MSNHPVNTNPTEEIDLGYLFRKIGDAFKSGVKTAFQIIVFFLKYKFIVIILIVIGFAYGYYKDANSKITYTNEGIVIPNFESVDYLYDKVNALNAKISARDTVFLQQVLDTNFKKIRKIEIEPVTDIYNLMTKSREQIDVFRILFQNQDLSDFVEDMTTSKYYKYHRIKFRVRGDESSEKIISDIFNYWNNSSHYNEYAEIFKQNTEFQVQEIKNMIAQIDSVLASIASGEATNTNPGVVMNDYGNLHMLIQRKSDLLNELLATEVRLADYTQPVKLVNMDYNIEVGQGLSNKIKYPVYLILLFSGIFLVRYGYQKMKEIAESN